MRPKFNKLITLLLLLGIFAFLMEAERRVSTIAHEELSKWASLLPVTPENETESINPFKQNTSILQALLVDTTDKKHNSLNN